MIVKIAAGIAVLALALVAAFLIYAHITYPMTSVANVFSDLVSARHHPHASLRQQTIAFLPYWRLDNIDYARYDLLSEVNFFSLTIGPNGRVRANIFAKDVVVHGKIEGNIRGTERVELRKSAVLTGDIATQRIVIEDGAFFKGSIDIQKAEAKAEPVKAAVAAPGPSPSTPAPIHTPVTSSAQAPLLDRN